jgi:hypothetical protein
MRLDKLTIVKRTPARRLGGYNSEQHNVDGYSNYVASDAERITIVGDANTIYSKARNISLVNTFGVVIGAGVSNVMVVDTNDIVINESDVTYINGVKIKDGNVIQADANLVVDGGQNVVQNLFGCNTIELVEGGLDEVRAYNSQSNIHVLDGSNNTA